MAKVATRSNSSLLPFIAVSLAMITALVSFDVKAQGGRGPALVEADEVVEQPLARTVPVIGRLVAVQSGTVSALSLGPVLQVHVEIGGRVSEGDVLVTQATDRQARSRDVAQQAVALAEAAVGTAQAQLNQAQQELARLERLSGSAAFSAAQRDDKRFEVAVRRAQVSEARARVVEAQAQLDEAQLEVDLGIVRAPYSGVVIDKHTVRGAYLRVGDPVITLLNEADLEVEADVPTDRISGLDQGTVVGLRMGTNVPHSAVVRAVVPAENALTRTRQVRFIPDFSDDPALKPAAGQTATVDLPVGRATNVVTVHKDAVLVQGTGRSVFVIGEGGVVSPRLVTLGEAVGSRFVVEGGLSVGDMVVTRGNERLRPGQAVTYPGMPQTEENSEELQEAPAASTGGGNAG